MQRITTLFQQQQNKILSIYFTAGFPALDSTKKVLQALENNGVDMVEIGMPYSDPLADGPTIQDSSQQALQNGMSIAALLEQLADVRETIKMPIVLMGYLNPILQYGMEDFLKKCKTIGIDGLILPDLPLEEYKRDYQALFEQYTIAAIFLVTPETTKERLQKIDALGNGFIYAVSSSSTTGKDKDWREQEKYFKRLKNSDLKNPVLTGFGVKDKSTFKAASQHTQGAIIGTAFIKALKKEGELAQNITDFIARVKA